MDIERLVAQGASDQPDGLKLDLSPSAIRALAERLPLVCERFANGRKPEIRQHSVDANGTEAAILASLCYQKCCRAATLRAAVVQ